jgi:N-alpha-acetyltransferase 15/16, NatA auxiliary subunit
VLTGFVGIKVADQILRKNPNHGDTLAMKALIINSQGRPEEAFVLAKVALRNDMKSHVCWHVYGLLYRAEKNFEEAIKAYKFALKLEPESQQIQRDLALLQVQMRDYHGYIESRRAMLQARPQIRQNWTALAIAYHLAGNLASAEDVLTKYEETLKNLPQKPDIEHSEALLYKNTIIAETGEIERALEHLQAACKGCLDRLAVMEMKGDYLLRLGRDQEAEKAYRALIDRNPEYRAYYDGLEKSLGVREDRASLKDVYDEIAAKNPRGDAARRIPLEFLHGNSTYVLSVDCQLMRYRRRRFPGSD